MTPKAGPASGAHMGAFGTRTQPEPREREIDRGSLAAPRPGAARAQDRVVRFGHGSRVPGWDQSVDLDKDPQEVPDPAAVYVPAELRAEIEGHMAKYPDRRSAALPALAAAQRLHGWCSPDALLQVATVMQVTPAYLESVATFYDMLDTEHAERHRIYVCTNISCSLNGADALYERFEAEAEGDERFNIRHFECLGACDMAPMASIDGVYVGPIELGEVRELLDQVGAGQPPLPAKQLVNRRCADPEANSRDWPAPQGGEVHLATATEGLSRREPERDEFGGRMEGDQAGPSAAIEQAPEIDSEDESS